MAQYRFSGRAISLTLIGLASCIGKVDAPSQYEGDLGTASGVGGDPDSQEPVDTDGDGVPDSPRPGQGGDGDGDGSPDGPSGDGDQGDGDDAGYRFATLGERCSGGKRERFVVVSRAKASCEEHARALDDAQASDVLRLAVGDGGEFSGAVSLCEGGSCSDVNVSLTLSEDGKQADLDAQLADGALARSLEVESCDYDAVVPPARDALAADIAIREFSLNQGVKVALAANGQEVSSRNAPIVEGRAGLARIFVEPGAAFDARTIIGRLTLDNGDAEPEVLEQQLSVSGASSDASLDTSFNFELSASQVRSGTRYSVSLHEVEACGGVVDEASRARFPASGTSELAAESPGTPFRVKLVPVQYNADGSGRTPDLSAGNLESFRQYLTSVFPVAEVDISVRAPMAFNGSVLADGSGWSELLDQCLSQRDADNDDPRVYYYCIFDPAASFANYCRGGCVAGLGPVPSAGDQLRRGAIGLGFGDAGGTMAHELGHSLGLPHAPCGGVAGPDPNFPYAGGGVGSWGYDARTKTLLSPDNHSDLMGYCDNEWISDYTYENVFNRFQSVLTATLRVGASVELTSVIVDADSSLKLGTDRTLSHVPPGEAVRVRYLDAQGDVLLEADGTFAAVTHVTGGIVYVPRAPHGTARVSIEGFGELAL